jgi:hypothetical protein
MRNRSRRSRRKKSQNSDTRIKWIKILVLLFVLFIPFQKETLYYLKFFYYYIRLKGLVPVELVNPDLAGVYFVNLFIGLVVYIVSLYLFAFFNAQFLLPVYEWKERIDAYKHFLQFSRGNYGPLIFVQNGDEIAHYGEKEKKGPGVVLIDSNSAVVVGKKVHGPGIVFTGGKGIKAIFDLRKQVRTQNNVTAVTRDGIEIETDIFVEFSISKPAYQVFVTQIDNQIKIVEVDDRGEMVIGLSSEGLGEEEQLEIKRGISILKNGDPDDLPLTDDDQYIITRFVKDRVQAVFDNQPRDPQTGKKIDWRELPLTIAIEEFRNTIVRFPYDDLFIKQESQKQSRNGQGTDYPLTAIRREFSKRVRKSGMVSYIFLERSDGMPLALGHRLSDRKILAYLPVDLQFPRPLRRSVITVSSVGFGEITPTNEEVKNQTVQNLIARWNSEAFKTEVGFDEKAALIRSRAKAQVQQDTVYALAEFLQNNDQMRTAMILRIFQALEAATSESQNQELVSMVNMLGEFREWFLKEHPDEFNDFLEGEG